MKASVLMQPLLVNKYGQMRVVYNTDPYQSAEGPLRSMQKYAVILLSKKTTDAIRPWFGTDLPDIRQMNMYDGEEIKLFIRDQVRDATEQFFLLQSEETNLTKADMIISIDLVNVTITNNSNISIEIRFTPEDYQSLVFSVIV